MYKTRHLPNTRIDVADAWYAFEEVRKALHHLCIFGLWNEVFERIWLPFLIHAKLKHKRNPNY